MKIETIYKVWCPKCYKFSYVNNGNTDDLTVQDVEGIECPYCKHCFQLNDDRNDIGNEYEPSYELAEKHLPACWEKP